ncbi:MAG: type I-E CRISPR-associated protein Cas7/Cse4/CasC [Planctomycetota bacterium]
MLIEIHMIQNHSPANLNRDDLGAPKTCYFGGVLRSRISSQCLKRSIRMSDEFKKLLGGVATRRLAQLIADKDMDLLKKAKKVLVICGIAPKEKKGSDDNDLDDDDKSAGRVYVSRKAVHEMSMLLKNGGEKSDQQLATEFAKLIANHTAVPDMALCGRMLEPKKPKKPKEGEKNKSGDANEVDEGNEKAKEKSVWKELDLTVEAALQVAHAISTHEARPEVDYFGLIRLKRTSQCAVQRSSA